MERKEIREKLLEIIDSPDYNPRKIEICEDTRLRDDLGLESLGILDLALEIENNFEFVEPGKGISDEDLARIRTFGDAVNYVSGRLNYKYSNSSTRD